MGIGPEQQVFLRRAAQLSRRTSLMLGIEDPATLSPAQISDARKRLQLAARSLKYAEDFPNVPASAHRLLNAKDADTGHERGDGNKSFWLAMLEPKLDGTGLLNSTNLEIARAATRTRSIAPEKYIEELQKFTRRVPAYRRGFRNAFAKPTINSGKTVDAHNRTLDTLAEARKRWPAFYPDHVTNEQMAGIIAGKLTITKLPTGEITISSLDRQRASRASKKSIPVFARQRVPFVPLRPPMPTEEHKTEIAPKRRRTSRQKPTASPERVEQRVVDNFFDPAEQVLIGTAILTLNKERVARRYGLFLTKDDSAILLEAGRQLARQYGIQPVDLQLAKDTLRTKMNRLLALAAIRQQMANTKLPEDLSKANFRDLIFTLIGPLAYGNFIKLRDIATNNHLPLLRSSDLNTRPQTQVS